MRLDMRPSLSIRLLRIALLGFVAFTIGEIAIADTKATAGLHLLLASASEQSPNTELGETRQEELSDEEARLQRESDKPYQETPKEDLRKQEPVPVSQSGTITPWYKDSLFTAVIAAVGGAIIGILALYFTLRSRKSSSSIPNEGQKEIHVEPEEGTATISESATAVEELPASGPNLIATVSNLKLSNVRSFSSLDLEFVDTGKNEPSGSWVLMLGDNAVGKSTILRSFVLALADPDVSTALIQTQETPRPFIRRGETRGAIEVTLNDRYQYALEIRPGKTTEKLAVLDSPAYRPTVFAYGPQRGSAVGRSARQVTFSPISSVATLFDESAELIHAETWLLQRKFDAMNSSGGSDEAFFDSVVETVLQLLPGVESIEVTSSGVNLSGPEVGTSVPLAGMSDGYLGTMGWVLDFIARWSHHYESASGISVGGSIAKHARALVFVDEIGLHLHPRWQASIVENLRTNFPHVSFVTTSHHPLVLIGANQGEIYVLRRNAESSNVEIEQANIPPGISADEILTGRWFNLPSTLDKDTKDLLANHRNLLRKGASEDDERLVGLEDELRRRLGTFADTSIDRMALQVAAEVMHGKESSFDQLSPKRKNEIRQEMLVDLQSRVKEKK